MPKIDQNDPRLTAYALDEMSAAERAAFEPLLRDDPAARAFVEELRSTAALLGDALATEELPERCVVLPVPRQSWLGRLLTDSWTVWAPLGVTAAFGLYFWQVYLPRHDRELRAAQVAAAHEAEESGIPFHQVSLNLTAEEPAPATDAASPAGPHRPEPPPGFNETAQTSLKTAHFLATKQYPSSAFGINVGTAAFTDVRRCLEAGLRPPTGLVRIEELVNHFAYNYPLPAVGDNVTVATEMHPAPWAGDHLLVRIGLQGRETTHSAEAKAAAAATPTTVPTTTAERGAARELLANHSADEIRELAARDVKVRVDFNPAKVLAYRLLGYEGRLLRADDSNGAGNDLAAGRGITALYELIPLPEPAPAPRSVARAQRPTPPPTPDPSNTAEWLTVKLRYTDPDTPRSRSVIVPLHAAVETAATPAVTSTDFQFAAAVAGFGLILQDNPNKGDASWDMVEALAKAGLEDDPSGQRGDFVSMIEKAREVAPTEAKKTVATP